ncbi:MAG TPA: DNA polymerase III subunit delta' [Rudaea sp.]|nr:DNA polymerase III subunit delta' [Rudaea sp.]
MTRAAWHDEAWRTLAERRARGMLPHALLVCGPAGLGKRELASGFAAALLCQQPGADGSACGTCRACQLVAAGSHPDLVHVGLELRDDGKPRTEITVEQIRRLCERLALTAQFGGYQIAIVDPADAMNPSAANALLKTLEEPTPASIIVLLADEPARLPATIRSRCQRIELKLPGRDAAQAWLAAHGVPAATAMQALDAAAGNPGIALAWARSDGLAVRERVIADLRALHTGKAAAVAIANRWAKEDVELHLWLLASVAGGEARAHAAGRDGPLALTSRIEFTKLSAWFDRANRARRQLRGPLRPELVVLEALAESPTAKGL